MASKNSESSSLSGNSNEHSKFIPNLFQTKAWMDKPIVVCYFNAYEEPSLDQQPCIPLEIGLTAFTLNQGVVDNFGRVIDPFMLPPRKEEGLLNLVSKLGMSPPMQTPDFCDYDDLLIIIEDFLIKHGSRLDDSTFCVFTWDKAVESVRNCFKWLSSQSNNFFFPRKNLNIEVLSLSHLVHLASIQNVTPSVMQELSGKMIKNQNKSLESSFQVAGNRRPGLALNKEFIYPQEGYPLAKFGILLKRTDLDEILEKSDNYQRVGELCCLYHCKKRKGIEHCALARTNRVAFHILEILTLSNPVQKLVPGAHYPNLANLKDEKIQRLGFLEKWGITRLERWMEDSRDSNQTHICSPSPLSERKENSRNSRLLSISQSFKCKICGRTLGGFKSAWKLGYDYSDDDSD